MEAVGSASVSVTFRRRYAGKQFYIPVPSAHSNVAVDVLAELVNIARDEDWSVERFQFAWADLSQFFQTHQRVRPSVPFDFHYSKKRIRFSCSADSAFALRTKLDELLFQASEQHWTLRRFEQMWALLLEDISHDRVQVVRGRYDAAPLSVRQSRPTSQVAPEQFQGRACKCTDSECSKHLGVSCTSKEQLNGLCDVCYNLRHGIRSGHNKDFWCCCVHSFDGCSSCLVRSKQCRRRRATSADKDDFLLCVPCLAARLVATCHTSNLEMGYVPSVYTAVVDEVMALRLKAPHLTDMETRALRIPTSAEETRAAAIAAQCCMRVAICTALMARLCDVIVLAGFPVDLGNADTPTPKYIVLRATIQCEWSVRSLSAFYDDHLRPRARCGKCQLPGPWDVQLFRGVASGLQMVYAGTWVNTLGDTDTFQSDADQVPYFPATVPSRHRLTYWRWRPRDGCHDILIATLDSLLVTLIDLFGLGCPSDPSIYPSAVRRVWAVPAHFFVLRFCRLQGSLEHASDARSDSHAMKLREYLLPSDTSVWSSRPSGVIRPLALADYTTLGVLSGYVYLGARAGGGHMLCKPMLCVVIVLLSTGYNLFRRPPISFLVYS